MVEKAMLDRIMGAEGSPTGKLVALRRDPGEGQLETGVWYSNFTRVHDEAAARGLPFFAMWTNGDLCGFCKRFTFNILEPTFLEWMKSSGGLFWLGGSMDDNDEDKRNGKGFMWGLGPARNVSYFPFFAVEQVESGRPVHQLFGSGHFFDMAKKAPEGTPLIIAKIKEVLSKPPMPSEDPLAKNSGQAKAKQATAPQASPVKLNKVLHIRFNTEWDVQHIARFQNALRESGGHCICRKDRTPDTMCMCKDFLEQDKPGRCHCGAFEKYEV